MSVAPWPDHLLTLSDWDHLPEDAERRYELVEGILVVSPRPVIGHQRAMMRLIRQLGSQIPAGWELLTESEVLVVDSTPPTVRVPDLVIIDSATDPSTTRLTGKQVHLAIEIVSPGSVNTDQIVKLYEYANAGIGHYWIVQTITRTVARYGLIDSHYERFDGTDRGMLHTESPAPFSLDLDALFD